MSEQTPAWERKFIFSSWFQVTARHYGKVTTASASNSRSHPTRSEEQRDGMRACSLASCVCTQLYRPTLQQFQGSLTRERCCQQWTGHPSSTLDSLSTDKPTTPNVESLSLRLSFQVIQGYTILTIKINHPTMHIGFFFKHCPSSSEKARRIKSCPKHFPKETLKQRMLEARLREADTISYSWVTLRCNLHASFSRVGEGSPEIHALQNLAHIIFTCLLFPFWLLHSVPGLVSVCFPQMVFTTTPSPEDFLGNSTSIFFYMISFSNMG